MYEGSTKYTASEATSLSTDHGSDAEGVCVYVCISVCVCVCMHDSICVCESLSTIIMAVK